MRALTAFLLITLWFVIPSHSMQKTFCEGRAVLPGDLLVERRINNVICWYAERGGGPISGANLVINRGTVALAYVMTKHPEIELDYDPIINIKKKLPRLEGEPSAEMVSLVRRAMKTLCVDDPYRDTAKLAPDGLKVRPRVYNQFHKGWKAATPSLLNFHIRYRPEARECVLTLENGVRQKFVMPDIGDGPPGILLSFLRQFFDGGSAFADSGRYSDLEVEIAKGQVVGDFVIANFSMRYRRNAEVIVQDLSGRNGSGRLFIPGLWRFQ